MTTKTAAKPAKRKTAAKTAAPKAPAKPKAPKAPANPGAIKTVKAKSLPTRVAIAWAGTKDAPLAKPVHATAYTTKDGVKVALATGDHQNVDADTYVRYAPDAVAAKATGLRWCKGGTGVNDDGTRVCPEPHLKRIGGDKLATAYCDKMQAWYRANPMTLAEYREYQSAQKAKAIAAEAGVEGAVGEPLTDEQKAEGEARAKAALTVVPDAE